MAGLGRIQQRFNAAIVAVLALAGLSNMSKGGAKEAAAAGYGHPIHAKYLRSLYNKIPARKSYPGYCAGNKETERRFWRLPESQRGFGGAE